MLSKHPLDLPTDRRLRREEVLDALRLSIIAELDAINLYLQIARSIDDERVKRVFEDIAREEKTHVGEFLALLKELDAEQARELEEGAREVAELSGAAPPAAKGDPQEAAGGDFNSRLIEKFRASLTASRVVLNKLPKLVVGRGVEGVPYPVAEGGERKFAELKEVSLKFRIPQRAVDYYAKYGILDAPEASLAARQLAAAEERFLIESLLSCERAKRVKIGDWSTPGRSVTDISLALAELYKSGARKPVLLILPPNRYVNLLSISDRTGVMDVERVRALVDEIAISNALPEDTAILLLADPSVADVVIGGDGEVDYIGPEDSYHVYRAWSSLAVRVKDPSGLVILVGEK